MHGLKSIRVETLGSRSTDGTETDKKLVSNKTNNVEFHKRGRTTEGAAVSFMDLTTLSIDSPLLLMDFMYS